MKYLTFVAEDCSGWELELVTELAEFLAEEGYVAVSKLNSIYEEPPMFFLASTTADFPAVELSKSYDCVGHFMFDVANYPTKEIARKEFEQFYEAVVYYYNMATVKVRNMAKVEKKDNVIF